MHCILQWQLRCCDQHRAEGEPLVLCVERNLCQVDQMSELPLSAEPGTREKDYQTAVPWTYFSDENRGAGEGREGRPEVARSACWFEVSAFCCYALRVGPWSQQLQVSIG